VEYAYVTTDKAGSEQVVARGTRESDVETPSVGDTVTLEGADGVERQWKIVRKVPMAYAGETLYVEPLEFE
jgi:transcription elongation GreA/GreB family factor